MSSWAKKTALVGVGVLVLAVVVVWFGLRSYEFTTGVRFTTGKLPRLKGPVWNVWPETYSPTKRTFMPLATLELANGSAAGVYSLVVELSGVAFEHLEQLYSREIDPSLNRLLTRAPAGPSYLDVLAIPDERFFRPLDAAERLKRIPISLEKMRQFEALPELDQHQVLRHGLSLLRASDGGKAPFSYGREQFRIEPIRAGLGWVALAVMINRRPVDEINVPLCIVSTPQERCPTPTFTPSTLAGVDPIVHGQAPDASLHLIELGDDQLVGVFHAAEPADSSAEPADRFITWFIPRPAAWLQQTVTTQISPLLLGGASHYRQAGEALFRTIFYRERPLEGEMQAEKAFRDFISKRIARHRGAPGPAGTLFVRLLPQKPSTAFSIPIDLALVKLTDGSDVFLGSHFLTQSPLPLQDYSLPSDCLGTWALLVPPRELGADDYPAMHGARFNLGPWADRFDQWKSNATLFDDIDRFDTWLKAPDTASVVVTLSHHYENRLCFENDTCSSGASIVAIDVNKPLTSPSLAIINGCATARPGATEFIREFNAHGASTVIATSTSVEGELAGAFLSTLFTKMQDNAADGQYTVGRAKFDAVRELIASRQDNAPLIYTLLGNGALRVCMPPKQ
jgi:hypothetical protein